MESIQLNLFLFENPYSWPIANSVQHQYNILFLFRPCLPSAPCAIYSKSIQDYEVYDKVCSNECKFCMQRNAKFNEKRTYRFPEVESLNLKKTSYFWELGST